jgi:protein-S-isoprenylcysteine O-methyltransferase Ste14
MPHFWPGLCIGIIVGFYWARVIKLVLKQRRRTGRSANFLPAEPMGRFLRLIWYPLVALWIALPLLAAWHTRDLLCDLPLVQWSAVGVAICALALTMACWRRMGKSWRMGIDPDEKTHLIVSGPYAYVRHPIYALSSVLMISSAVAVPSIAMIAIAVLHCGLLQWEARREEAYLIETHGQAYRDYLASVGRFIPKSLSAHRPV